MNVRELMAKLSRLDPELPVVMDVEDPELVGSYVEVMHARFSDNDVCFDAEGYSCDGSKPYTRPDWGLRDTKGKPCEPVALLSCMLPRHPTIEGQVVDIERLRQHPEHICCDGYANWGGSSECGQCCYLKPTVKTDADLIRHDDDTVNK